MQKKFSLKLVDMGLKRSAIECKVPIFHVFVKNLFLEQCFTKLGLFFKSALNCASNPISTIFKQNIFLVTYSDKDDIREHKNAPSQITAN